METTILEYVGFRVEGTIVYWGYIGIMKDKMKTTIGFRVAHGIHLNVLASTNLGQMDGGIQEHTSHIVFHPAQPKVSPW